MIRYLNGLNEKDAVHELQNQGIPAPEPADVLSIRENFAAKVAGFTPEQSRQFRNALSRLKEVNIISAGENHPAADFTFYLPHSQKLPFLQKLKKETGKRPSIPIFWHNRR